MIYKIKENSLYYPKLLKEISDNPKSIYVLGNILNLRKKCIAIVGTRKCTDKGKIIAEKIAYEYAKKGYVIVSGLAIGIDTAAHIGALKAKGRTIAVLGHGLDRIYPDVNKELAKKIIKNNGTIITEYSFKDEFKPENFPRRNRIINGLCEKVIIAEAKEKSGSIITANLAIEENRELLVIPRDISTNSQGLMSLLKLGAKLL